MASKHRVVAKDWAVVEVINRFLDGGIGRTQHADIKYKNITRDRVFARVKVLRPEFEVSFEFTLRKNQKSDLWEARGKFVVMIWRLDHCRTRLRLGRYEYWVALDYPHGYSFTDLDSDKFYDICRRDPEAQELVNRNRFVVRSAVNVG